MDLEKIKVLHDWFPTPPASPNENNGQWILVMRPPLSSTNGGVGGGGWNGCYSMAITWLKDTTRASLADAIAPRVIGGTIGNWVTALVLRQYILPLLF